MAIALVGQCLIGRDDQPLAPNKAAINPRDAVNEKALTRVLRAMKGLT